MEGTKTMFEPAAKVVTSPPPMVDMHTNVPAISVQYQLPLGRMAGHDECVCGYEECTFGHVEWEGPHGGRDDAGTR